MTFDYYEKYHLHEYVNRNQNNLTKIYENNNLD